MKNKTGKTALAWTIVLALLLILLPFLVPSAMRTGGAEGIIYDNLPVYDPVELGHPDAGPAAFREDRNGNPVALNGAHADGIRTDPPGYLDETLSIRMEWRTVTNCKGVDTPILFTYIQIADPSQMCAVFSGPYYATNEVLVHQLAKRYNAVLAFDGDWCQNRVDGWVVRNGVEYRRNRYTRSWMLDALIVDKNGDFHILQHPELEELSQFEGNVLHSFVFGPAMVIDGEPVFQEKNNYGTDGGMWLEKCTQRQVFCQMGPLSYLLITTEGEDSKSLGGFTGNEMAQIAHDCGALQAYNLDGGASAQTVLVNGYTDGADGVRVYSYARINDPTIPNRRPICDIIYFCPAEPEE